MLTSCRVRCVLDIRRHTSEPNRTPDPRRLVIFAHCPAQQFVHQLHASAGMNTIQEGAREIAYLQALVGEASSAAANRLVLPRFKL